MKQKISTKSLLIAAAVTLGFVTFASAQSANVSPPNPAAPAGQGLLGQTYTGLTFDYLMLKNGPPSAARGFTFTYNQALNDGFDATLDYQRLRSKAAGVSYTHQEVGADLTAFTTCASWGKPFLTAGVGEEWQRGGGFSDHSFTYKFGGGVEFQPAPAIALSPYVNFVRATHFNQNEGEYGVRASYRMTNSVSLLAKVQYNDISHAPNSTQLSVGVNYHF